jgi:short-subunit dehydrogenase
MEGLVVVITGASSGIGRATAHEFASKGASVVLVARDRIALDDARIECEDLGGTAIAVPADTANESDVKLVAQQALDAFGRIDVWVNNASITLFARFDLAPPDVYRRVIETNFFGYVNGARAALAEFRRQGYGLLVNVASVVSGTPQPFTSAYVASKYAVRGWSACLRMELKLEKLHDIHVCTVMPSAIDTPIFQHGANYTGRAAKALRPAYPPEKVARTIVSLVQHPRDEVVVGAAGKAMLKAAASRKVYEKVAARHIDRDHFQDRPATASDGNAFTSTGPHSVTGGWNAKPQKPAMALALATTAGVLAVAAVLRKLAR